MHRKLRLITTLFTLLSISILLMIAIPLGVYAATSAYITGSGKLSVELSPSNQKDLLKSAGLHATGSGSTYTLADMEIDDLNNPAENRRVAMEDANILSFNLYKKASCEQNNEQIYQLEVKLDFSNYDIHSYAGDCINFYNIIVFAKNNDGSDFTQNLPVIDYYTGKQLEDENGNLLNANVVFNSEDYAIVTTIGGNSIDVVFTYNISLNTLPKKEDDTSSNYGYREDCFNIDNETTLGKVPKLITLDLSETNISIDENGNLIGFEYDGNSEGKLSNVSHIHFVASADSQLEAAMLVAKGYATNAVSNVEIALYKKVSNNAYKIECKINIDTDIINIIVVDITENEINKTGIINMVKWCINNMTNEEYVIYSQPVDINHMFIGNAKLVTIEETTTEYIIKIEDEEIGRIPLTA